MHATIQKWGNSLALRIPMVLAKQIQLQEGDGVLLKVSDSKITLSPVTRRPSLDELLANVTADNLHPATEWGADVGKEILPQ